MASLWSSLSHVSPPPVHLILWAMPPHSLTDEPYVNGPRLKFFPPLATFDPPYPVAPDGYLPNSVLLQKLRKSEEDQRLAEQWQPPSLSDKQRRLMAEMEEAEEEEEEEDVEDSDLMARLHAAVQAPVESPESTPSPSPPPSPPPEPPRVSTLPILPFSPPSYLRISLQRELRTQMKVEKIIAKRPPPP